MKIPLEPGAAGALTFQSYEAGPDIDGVFRVPLRKHRNLGGSFMELARLSDGRVEGLPITFEPKQISIATATPGRINAFHVHPKRAQDEVWCVLDGEMLVWLADVRGGSATQGHRVSVLLSGESPEILHIPAGVAHGYKACAAGATLLYAATEQFDPADPDEGRLPWDYFGEDLWAEDRG